MTDTVSREVRHRMMSGIKGKNTGPEILVRKFLHEQGFRYRIQRRDLPGRPDIVLPKHSAVVFVHGCFWHGHNCHLFKVPATRTEWWREKIETNRARDDRAIGTLLNLGWRVMIVWECAIKGRTRRDRDEIVEMMKRWLLSETRTCEILGRNEDE